jgi:cytochrome oxidase assembly protein ShyY1
MRPTTSDGPHSLDAPAGPERYRFLASARWARIIAGGLLVSLACTLLGVWQWNRHTARVAAAELVEANYDADPVPLTNVLADPSAELRRHDVWRPVTASGTYLPRSSVLLRNRPVEGAPAHHVLALLEMTDVDGRPTVLVLDRGWLPAGTEVGPAGVPPLPQGVVDVVVRLRAPEQPTSRDAPSGQVYAVDPEEVAAAAGTRPGSVTVLDAYGVLADEEPEPASAPRPLPRPETDLGTHLSYTFQWWVFALGALVGVAVLARREAQALSGAAPSAAEPGRTGSRGSGRTAGPHTRVAREHGGRRPGRAEQEEDAILDAQQAAPGGAAEWRDGGATLMDRR